jgi:SAM-dependent methyltransferase
LTSKDQTDQARCLTGGRRLARPLGRLSPSATLLEAPQTAPFLYTGTELDAMGGATNYYRWILGYICRYATGRAVEVGAGTGTVASALLACTRISELTLIEPAGNLFFHLANRFVAEARVRVVRGYLRECRSWLQADCLIAVNVIEHIAEDVHFLQSAREILVPGGALLLFTPAVPFLYGSLDRAFGHERRYWKHELSDKVRRAGFELEQLRYINFPGVLAWFVAARILRRETIRTSDVRAYDRWVVPWLSRLERYWEPPLGQNLLVIARNPGGEE